MRNIIVFSVLALALIGLTTSQIANDVNAEKNSSNGHLGCEKVDENKKVCEKNPASNLDLDNDGILDVHDNCQSVSNPQQSDVDLDGLGDLCDQYSGEIIIFKPSNNPPVILYYNDGPDFVSQNPLSFSPDQFIEFSAIDCTTKNNVNVCYTPTMTSSSYTYSTFVNVLEFGEIFQFAEFQDPSVPFDLALRQLHPEIPFELTVITQDPSVPFDLIVIDLDGETGTEGFTYRSGVDETLPFDLRILDLDGLMETGVFTFKRVLVEDIPWDFLQFSSDSTLAFEWKVDETTPFDPNDYQIQRTRAINEDLNLQLYVDPLEPLTDDSTSSFSQLIAIDLSSSN